MKAILEFNLPEDQEEFDAARLGMPRAILIEELDNLLRNKAKYEGLKVVSIEEVRDLIRSIMEDYE